jgi:hypothetical protein
MSAPVDVLEPGMYWQTKFATVSSGGSVRTGRRLVRVLGAVHGERGRYYRVMLPHGVVGIVARADLARVNGGAA